MAITAVILMGFISSCSSDEPGINIDYGKLQLGKMNLSGAKQLALKTGSVNSRAIDGEYLSVGLYKIDENGNIAAVGVYFTTDTLGNRLEKEYALKVVPTKLFQLTDDFALVTECEYYDSDGDILTDSWIYDDEDGTTGHWVLQDVPYKNLLIRLTDGKIWCVDNVIDYFYWFPTHELSGGNWKQDKNGNLFGTLNGGIYRFNLSNQDASLEQIFNFTLGYYGYNISDNGVLWADEVNKIGLYWPQSGYQYLEVTDLSRSMFPDFIYPSPGNNKHYLDSEGNEITPPEDESYGHRSWEGYYYRDCGTSTYSQFYCINNDGNPGVICLGGLNVYQTNAGTPTLEWYQEHIDTDIASYCDIVIGDSPGGAILSEPITLGIDNAVHSLNYSCDLGINAGQPFAGDGYILYLEKGSNRLSKIDLKNREWTILKTLERYVNFNIEFAGKAWGDVMYNIGPGVWHCEGVAWVDLTTFEDGYVPFNVNIPEWMTPVYRGEGSPINTATGYVEYRGTNPNNLNEEVIYIDIMTGEATHSVTTPEYSFETLISLN